jgi:hypothetical protein
MNKPSKRTSSLQSVKVPSVRVESGIQFYNPGCRIRGWEVDCTRLTQGLLDMTAHLLSDTAVPLEESRGLGCVCWAPACKRWMWYNPW